MQAYEDRLKQERRGRHGLDMSAICPHEKDDAPDVRCLPYGMMVKGSVSSHLSCILCSSYLEVNDMTNWCSVLLVGLID